MSETPNRPPTTTVSPTPGQRRIRIPSGPEESAERFIARLRGLGGLRPSEPDRRTAIESEPEAAERHSARLSP